MLVADEKDVLKFVSMPDLMVFEYLKSAQKPTTVIYEGAIGLAQILVASDGTIGIRIVQDDFCRHLIKRFRKPIVSTSANISRAVTARIFSEISDEIKQSVDYVVQYRQDDARISEPSAVVKWEKNKLSILRS